MYLAVDIGGTKTEVAFFDGKDVDSLVESKSVPTEQNYATAKQLLFSTIDELLCGRSIQSVHVSFPGIIRGTEILQSSNIPDYFGKPLKAELEQKYGVPTSVLQDSVCSAIAEYTYGHINRYNKIVYLIMGTGIGGAYVHRFKGQTVISPLEPGGMVVNLREGRNHGFTQTTGILEAYVGGGNVEDYYRLKLANAPDNDKIWDEITDFLAAGINNLNCLLMPDVVVIGGGIGLKRQTALSPVIEKVQKYKEFVLPPTIMFTEVQGNSSLIGALAANFVDDLAVD